MTFIKLNIIKLDIKLVGWGTKIIESGPKQARPTNEKSLQIQHRDGKGGISTWLD